MNDSHKTPLTPRRRLQSPTPPSPRRRNSTTQNTPANPQRRAFSIKRFLARFVLLILVPIGIFLVAGWLYLQGGRFVETENAYVKANIIAISADLAGRVTAVGVEDNEWVTAGTLLFKIDAKPLDIAVAQANAEMAVVRNDIESLRAAYRQAAVEVAEAKEQARYFDNELRRQQTIAQRGVGTQKELDAARHDAELAKRRISVLRERVRQTLTNLNGNPDIDVEEHPRYVKAATNLDRALDQRARTTVRAPSAGIISNMKLQAGEYVEDGQAVFSLIESEPIWVEANLKETQLTHIRVGQSARFVADAYPDVTFDALVETIAPATGAEFSLLPPQNASGNWVKVVQRVPVRLRIADADGAQSASAQDLLLRAGMTVSVSIDTRQKREVPPFVVAAMNWLGLSPI